jgi:hypothetical protein
MLPDVLFFSFLCLLASLLLLVELLRQRLWKGFIDSPQCLIDDSDTHGNIRDTGGEGISSVQSSVLSLKRSLASIENYLSERLDQL